MEEIPEIREDLIEKGKFIARSAIIVFRASQRAAGIPWTGSRSFPCIFNLFWTRTRHVMERKRLVQTIGGQPLPRRERRGKRQVAKIWRKSLKKNATKKWAALFWKLKMVEVSRKSQAAPRVNRKFFEIGGSAQLCFRPWERNHPDGGRERNAMLQAPLPSLKYAFKCF